MIENIIDLLLSQINPNTNGETVTANIEQYVKPIVIYLKMEIYVCNIKILMSWFCMFKNFLGGYKSWVLFR